jgi:hypothetical protein
MPETPARPKASRSRATGPTRARSKRPATLPCLLCGAAAAGEAGLREHLITAHRVLPKPPPTRVAPVLLLRPPVAPAVPRERAWRRPVLAGAGVLAIAAVGLLAGAGSSSAPDVGYLDPDRLAADLIVTASTAPDPSRHLVGVSCVPAAQARSFPCHETLTGGRTAVVTVTVSADGTRWATVGG